MEPTAFEQANPYRIVNSIDEEFISKSLNGEKEYKASPILSSEIRFERYLNGERE